jgi:hypothetical protein
VFFQKGKALASASINSYGLKHSNDMLVNNTYAYVSKFLKVQLVSKCPTKTSYEEN